MKKLGFFGGCFNPITNAHLNLIKDVIQDKKLDKVYFVPMGDFYPKNDLIPLKQRLDMLNLVFENEEKIDILDISNTKQKTKAIDSFKIIEKNFPDDSRFFIMGSDNYEKINTWENADELINNYNYIILDRKDGNTKDISSSIVREKISLNEKFDDLVPKQIIKYIKENNLYK